MVQVRSQKEIEEILSLFKSGQKYLEIAKQFGCSKNSIAGVIYRSRKRLGEEVVERKIAPKAEPKAKAEAKAEAKKPPPENGTFVYVESARLPQEPTIQKESRIMAIERAKERIRVRLIETNTPVKLVDLESHHCRFPLGEPKNPDFRFCGASKKNDKGPYCPEHTIITSRFYEMNWKNEAEPLLNEAELKRYA